MLAAKDHVESYNTTNFEWNKNDSYKYVLSCYKTYIVWSFIFIFVLFLFSCHFYLILIKVKYSLLLFGFIYFLKSTHVSIPCENATKVNFLRDYIKFKDFYRGVALFCDRNVEINQKRQPLIIIFNPKYIFFCKNSLKCIDNSKLTNI